MTDFSKRDKASSVVAFIRRIKSRLGLRGKLLLALLPSIVAILLVTGIASYTVSEEFIDIALGRTVKVHTLAVAHEMEQYLDACRTDLLFFAQGDMRTDQLRDRFEKRMRAGASPYLELCYLPASGGQPVVLVQRDGTVLSLSSDDLSRVSPNPFGELEHLPSLKEGRAEMSGIMEVSFPLAGKQAANLLVKSRVIRLYTRVPASETAPEGVLFLSVEASELRNILSWYNSEQSPIWAFSRSEELRFSYYIDNDGWMLFQSADMDDTDGELTTYLARENFSGTLGRAGNAAAFRPNENHDRYWAAVAAVNEGEYGLQQVPEETVGQSEVDSFYFSYAPVLFRSSPTDKPVVCGGVIFVDRSQLPIIAGYKNLDVMLFVTSGAIILISILVFWFGRIFTKPIRALAESMNSLEQLEDMEEIRLPYSGYDINRLQESINSIIRRVKQQVVEIQARDEAILNVNKRERASLKKERATLAEAELSRIPEIIGQGMVISNMKVNILKAAQAGVDVLITGETGTGKQLVAEAIHNHSNRSEKPFVSINCGALDENLLLDALFGHVKGAFSEAKEDRNGAFIEANEGTLFLDEIQSASSKVQQSLLRAIATRKVKHLGSDGEVDVDVRIVAATNEDIPSLIESKAFREDLYYRLKVVSIATPPLREHRGNIPLLAIYYLQQAEQLAGRSNLGLSKGALSKLATYDWPGNVRELVNSITRAAIMAESDTIQAEEIRLENESLSLQDVNVTNEYETNRPTESVPVVAPPAKEDGSGPVIPARQATPLNARQKAAWPAIQNSGAVSRKQYQELVGGNLPTRTAIYDLQDFVKRGLLVKEGKGPSTRYEVVGN